MPEILHTPSNGEHAIRNAETVLIEQRAVVERVARITAPERLANPARERQATDDPQ